MALEHAILGFLSRGSMTGYDLKTRCFDDAAGHLWTADQAQVYRTLDRLAEQGFVRSRLVPQRGKPDRRVHSITQAGRKAYSQWLVSPVQPPPTRDPFLLHLFFAPDLPDAAVLALLENARGEYQRRLEQLRGPSRVELEAWGARTGRERDTALRLMTLAASTSATRSAIDWIDDSIERVRRGLPAPSTDETSAQGG
jgi:PadR family transcriptional regulator AphA